MSGPELRVSLDAFADNLRAVRARVAPARPMLVVKDDAYGQGLEPIVARAAASGIDLFGSFDVATGLRVRAVAGASARIFAWQSTGEADITSALEADIDLGVGDRDFLRLVGAVAAREWRTARVHLKIDTGLHRNGVRPEHWSDALDEARALQRAGATRVVGIWSHIAEASDAEDDLARARFDSALTQAQDAGFTLELRHLAASAAAFAREEFRYDAVRIGAFAYGVRSAGGPGEEMLGVTPIAQLRARVLRVDPGEATIGVGWAHGLPAALAGRMRVRSTYGEHDVTGIGMDETRIASSAELSPGDEVIVFGPGAASATDLAETLGTVGEEILTRVSPLVGRTYL